MLSPKGKSRVQGPWRCVSGLAVILPSMPADGKAPRSRGTEPVLKRRVEMSTWHVWDYRPAAHPSSNPPLALPHVKCSGLLAHVSKFHPGNWKGVAREWVLKRGASRGCHMAEQWDQVHNWWCDLIHRQLLEHLEKAYGMHVFWEIFLCWYELKVILSDKFL